MKAITGYLSIPGQINEMSRVRGDRMDPRIAFPDEILAGVGPQFRYDPVTNPYGARGDVYDHTVNVYGTIRNTPFPGDSKFAQRPLDNVGVQYGLRALNDGKITVEDFLDMNANMGGVDIDFNRIPSRTVHYPDATKRAYQGGRILYGGGGLAACRSLPAWAAMTWTPRRCPPALPLAGDPPAAGQRERPFGNQVVVGNLAPSELLIDRWASG